MRVHKMKTRKQERDGQQRTQRRRPQRGAAGDCEQAPDSQNIIQFESTQQETESMMIDTSGTEEPTTTRNKPGKKPGKKSEEIDRYIEKSNKKIYEIDQQIQYWD